jgi:hypothetical protein
MFFKTLNQISYSNGWAIHNDDNGEARLLNDQEVEAVKREFPDLQDEKVATFFADEVKSIKEKP